MVRSLVPGEQRSEARGRNDQKVHQGLSLRGRRRRHSHRRVPEWQRQAWKNRTTAAIGIIKGKPFAPDARLKKTLTEAAALANATSRTLFMAPRDPALYYYPGSGWQNMLFAVGYEFETPIP